MLELIISIACWVAFVALIIIFVALIWNMIDRIRGKEEETKETLALNKLTNVQTQLIKTINELIKRIDTTKCGI